jgi:nucleotide-binding universal stress UspA family protein
LVIVHVTELAGGKAGVYPAVDEDETRHGSEATAQRLRADGVDASTVLRSVRLGGPAHEIAEVAPEVDADVIVVGTRGRSPVGEVFLRSVLIRLLHIAHRPVLVVPPAG